MTQPNQSTPRPARERVILASDGFPPGQVHFTAHYFIGAVPVSIVVDGKDTPYWSFQYKCFETGAERRFGLADRTVLSQEEIDAVIKAEGN